VLSFGSRKCPKSPKILHPQANIQLMHIPRDKAANPPHVLEVQERKGHNLPEISSKSQEINMRWGARGLDKECGSRVFAQASRFEALISGVSYALNSLPFAIFSAPTCATVLIALLRLA